MRLVAFIDALVDRMCSRPAIQRLRERVQRHRIMALIIWHVILLTTGVFIVWLSYRRQLKDEKEAFNPFETIEIEWPADERAKICNDEPCSIRP